MKNAEKILVPIDFTEDAQELLSKACLLNKSPETEIIFLHVIPEVTEASYYIDSVHPWVDIQDNAILEAKRSLESYVNVFSSWFVHVKTMVEVGNPSSQIVYTANDINVEYILMGDHCRTGFQHFLHRNVAENVLRKAKRSVLSFYVPS